MDIGCLVAYVLKSYEPWSKLLTYSLVALSQVPCITLCNPLQTNVDYGSYEGSMLFGRCSKDVGSSSLCALASGGMDGGKGAAIQGLIGLIQAWPSLKH